jgi:hypothetical protein
VLNGGVLYETSFVDEPLFEPVTSFSQGLYQVQPGKISQSQYGDVVISETKKKRCWLSDLNQSAHRI